MTQNLPSQSPTPAQTDAPEVREVQVRRAPSVIAFLLVGLVIGLVCALFSTLFGPTDQAYTLGAIFGIVAVLYGSAGAVLGALVGLLLDWRSRRRARRFRAVPLTEDDAEATASADPRD